MFCVLIPRRGGGLGRVGRGGRGGGRERDISISLLVLAVSLPHLGHGRHGRTLYPPLLMTLVQFIGQNFAESIGSDLG